MTRYPTARKGTRNHPPECFAEGGFAGSIRLDLRAVTFMDASGVRALVRMHVHCEREGRSFSVHACSSHVERLLHSPGLYDILADDEDRRRLAVA